MKETFIALDPREVAAPPPLAPPETITRFHRVAWQWRMKARFQKWLSRVPMGRGVYYWGQRLLGGLSTYRVDSTVRNGLNLLELLAIAAGGIRGLKTVEIGTGWTPTLPILFWLYGASECDTYDVSRLVTNDLCRNAARQLVDYFSQTEPPIAYGPDKALFRRKLEFLTQLLNKNHSTEEILARCVIRYHAPCGAAMTGLPDESVDLVYSRCVLEHIPKEELEKVFAESYRVLKPGGRLLHYIDLDDQFIHSEPGIPLLYFLQFSDKEFERYNSDFCFQNRLRSSAFRKMFENTGFEIVRWQSRVNLQAASELPYLRLDPEFSDLTTEDLCTSSVYVLATKR